MKKETSNYPSGGFIFLCVLSSAIWFAIGLHNNPEDSILGIIIIALLLGVVSAFVLTMLFLIMKHWFKW